MHTTFVGVIRTFYAFFAILSWMNSKLMVSFSLGFPSFVSVKPGIYCQVEDEQWPSSWGYLLLKFHGCVDTSVLQNSWSFSFFLNLALLLEDECIQWGMNRAGLHAYVQQFPRPSNDAPPVQPNRKCLWRVYHLLLKSVGCIVSEKNLSDSLLFFEEFTD